ncbi:MAG: type 11 methyltransferase [Parcubacteria group bacterium Gr01-1014_72]|nr:MAG: type 11 methyltransferase [Parcubacteria group bacterium Gr01-1014_72]
MPSVYDIPFWAKGFYDHKARWIHYYYQVQFVANILRAWQGDRNMFRLLEVGPSHGFVTQYLRKFGVSVTTIDNKKEYSPDILGTVLSMPLQSDSYDMILVCEVLEHLPYDAFSKALAELFRTTRCYVLLSVPDVRRILFSIEIKMPFFKWLHITIRIPTFQKHVCPVPGGHQWEIGKKSFPPGRIRDAIKSAGFAIVDDVMFHDTPKNHYFLLEKPRK